MAGVAVVSTNPASSISAANPGAAGFATAYLVCAASAAVAAIIAGLLMPAGEPAAGAAVHIH